MRSTTTITDIQGNSSGTFFLEGETGCLWYVSSSGEVERVSSGGVKQVAVGGSHAAVLFRDGAVSVFHTYKRRGAEITSGEWRGQYGIGEKPSVVTGLMPTSLNDIKRVSCGECYTVALSHDGHLYAAGENGSGVFGNGTYSWTQPSGYFKMVQRGVINVVTGPSWMFVQRNDGRFYKSGSNSRHECGDSITPDTRDEPSIPSLMRVVPEFIATNLGRSVALDADGTVWHTGYGMSRNTWPENYHLRRREDWEIVPELRLRSVAVGAKGDVIALDLDGRVLSCGASSTRKMGRWSSGDTHLFENGLSGDQIALTPGGSFVKSDGTWFSSYDSNPHYGLTFRDDPEVWGHCLMFHPEDWSQVSNLRDLGISEEEAVKAAIALT